jgi:hypothetical protein
MDMSDTYVVATMYKGTRWAGLGGNMYPTNEPEELSNISSGEMSANYHIDGKTPIKKLIQLVKDSKLWESSAKNGPQHVNPNIIFRPSNDGDWYFTYADQNKIKKSNTTRKCSEMYFIH